MSDIPFENQELNLKVPTDKPDEEPYGSEAIGVIHEHMLDTEDDCPEIYITSESSYVSGQGSEDTDQPGVEHAMVTQLIINLRLCGKLYGSKPLLVHLKICGGDWVEGMAAYTALKAYPGPVVMLNYAEARSMSSILFCAGDRRVMMPDSRFMFHTGTISGCWTGRQFRTEWEEYQISHARMKQVYYGPMSEPGTVMEECTDEERDAWLELKMFEKEDAYLNAEESVAMGFAHSIFEDWDELLEFDD